jgi:hypothetical protein
MGSFSHTHSWVSCAFFQDTALCSVSVHIPFCLVVGMSGRHSIMERVPFQSWDQVAWSGAFGFWVSSRIDMLYSILIDEGCGASDFTFIPSTPGQVNPTYTSRLDRSVSEAPGQLFLY